MKQNSLPRHVQHWEILLGVNGSILLLLYTLGFTCPLKHSTSLLRCCSSLFSWIWASSYEMVQLPEMVFLILLERYCGRFWHCQQSLHHSNYQLHRGERSIPKSVTMKAAQLCCCGSDSLPTANQTGSLEHLALPMSPTTHVLKVGPQLEHTQVLWS